MRIMEQTQGRLSAEEAQIIEDSDIVGLSEKDLTEIMRSMSGYVERFRKLSAQEEQQLSEIAGGRRAGVNLYLFRFKEPGMRQMISEGLQRFSGRMPELRSFLMSYHGKSFKVVMKSREEVIPVRDLSQFDEETKKKVLGNMIQAQKKAHYDAYKKFPYGISFLKLAENDFLCLLAIGEDYAYLVNENGLLNELFRVNGYAELGGASTETVGFRRSMNYWSTLEPPLRNGFLAFSYRDTSPQLCALELDEKLTVLIDRLMKDMHISISGIFYAVWGIILGKYFKTLNVAIGAVNDTGKLNVAPIMVDATKDIKESFGSINSQLKGFSAANGCALEEIKQQLGIPGECKLPLILEFADMNRMESMVMSLPCRRVEHIGSCHYESVPLYILNTINNGEFRMEYQYQPQIFSEGEIEKLHQCFIQVLDGMLKTLNARADIVLTRTVDEAQLREANCTRIALCLKQSVIFKDCDYKELMKLAEQCRLITGTNEEIILQQNSYCDSFYVLGDGILEATAVNEDHILKTLNIIKKGAVFGIECLLENKMSTEQYSIYSETAECVEIPQAVMKETLQNTVSVQENLLEYMMKNLNRYRKLWLME